MTESSTAAGGQEALKLNSNVPQTARIWNHWLGGKDNFAADRAVGDQVRQAFPAIVDMARASRGFLVRAVTHLAGEAGIRQFLDIGTGLPTADNTHEVAQKVAPESRVVYVDFDPLVLVHARALLTSSPEGVTEYIDADLRHTDKILHAAALTLDLTQPTTLMLLGILGHIQDDDEAQSIVKTLMGALPSGSYLAISDGTDTSEQVIEAARIWNLSANPKYHLRSPERFARFFDGLELLDPGVVTQPQWRPDASSAGVPTSVEGRCGVGRKP